MALTPQLTEGVLQKLGLDAYPSVDAAGLEEVYAAWCRRVPFDNVVKRIHLASGSRDRIANGPPEAFFESWLRHGTGRHVLAEPGGLHALLVALGFDARRGSAAMFDNLSGPIHTHGTTLVRLDGQLLWVDSSMLTNVPLPLIPHEATRHDDPVSPVWSEPVADLWRVWWTGAIDGEEIGCLLLDADVTADHYLVRYEASRDMSPFNTMLYATRNTGGARVTLAFDTRFERRPDAITSAPLGADRARVMIEEFGYSEEIVSQLPPTTTPKSRRGNVRSMVTTLLPHYETADVRIEKIVVGPFENNVFVLRSKSNGDAVIIDAANEHELLLEVSKRTGVRRVLTTHGHADHIQAVTQMRDAGIDVGVAAEDAKMLPSYDFVIPDDDVIEIGDLRLRTIHTPGHTPGSTCFLLEGHPIVFSGDTLFPGGPGNTTFPDAELRHDHRVDRPTPVHPAGRHARAPRPRPRHHDRERVAAPRRVDRTRLVAGRAQIRRTGP